MNIEEPVVSVRYPIDRLRVSLSSTTYYLRIYNVEGKVYLSYSDLMALLRSGRSLPFLGCFTRHVIVGRDRRPTQLVSLDGVSSVFDKKSCRLCHIYALYDILNYCKRFESAYCNCYLLDLTGMTLDYINFCPITIYNLNNVVYYASNSLYWYFDLSDKQIKDFERRNARYLKTVSSKTESGNVLGTSGDQVDVKVMPWKEVRKLCCYASAAQSALIHDKLEIYTRYITGKRKVHDLT